jgi:hypothetical protein
VARGIAAEAVARPSPRSRRESDAGCPRFTGLVGVRMMWKASKPVLAWVLLWLSGALTVAKAMADWIGPAAFAGNAATPAPRAASAIGWLAAQPAPGVYAAALVLAGAGILLLLLLLPRSGPKAGRSGGASGGANPGPGLAATSDRVLHRLKLRGAPAQDEVFTHTHLLAFMNDHLLPACYAQVRFQEALVRHFCTDGTVADFAVMGIRNRTDPHVQTFWAHYDKLSARPASDPQPIGFDELVESIHVLEDDVYRVFCHQVDPILDKSRSGFNIDDHENLSSRREEWRKRHIAMFEAFRAIKRDIRFRKIIRPRRQSRWGPPMI